MGADFILNIIAGLTAYALQSKKPAIDIGYLGFMVV